MLAPCSLLLTPCSLLLAPYSLLLVPCSLLLVPCSLLLAPYPLPLAVLSRSVCDIVAVSISYWTGSGSEGSAGFLVHPKGGASDVAVRAVLQEGQGTGDMNRLAVLSQDVLSGGKIGGRQGRRWSSCRCNTGSCGPCLTRGRSGRRLAWPPASCSSGPFCSSLARKGARSRGPGCSVVWSRRLWSSTSTTSPPRTCTCGSCC